MMLELTRRGKIVYVQFSAILHIKNRFFFKGSRIVQMGNVSVIVDQDPVTIIRAMVQATTSVKEGTDKKPELKIQK